MCLCVCVCVRVCVCVALVPADVVRARQAVQVAHRVQPRHQNAVFRRAFRHVDATQRSAHRRGSRTGEREQRRRLQGRRGGCALAVLGSAGRGATDTLPKRKALPRRPWNDLLTSSSCSAR